MDPTEQKTGPQYPPPPYTQVDAKDREQFLSEIGNITPPQREIFHSLCKLWQPEIPFDRFLSQLSGTVKNVAHELERLMEKLSEKKCGLITVRSSDGETQRDKIVLTAPGDCRYYYFRLLNEYEAFYLSTDDSLPLEETLAAGGFVPPSACVENLTKKDFSRIFEDKTAGDYMIYRVALSDRSAILLPPGGGTRFIGHCLAKLRDALTNANLTAELARLRETSITDLKKRAESKDPLFWLEITKSIQLLKADPLACKRVQGSTAFFRMADILSGFIAGHLTELRRKKMAEEERLRDLEALAMQMEIEKEQFIPQERFDLLIGSLKDKYGEQFEPLRKEFLSRFVDFKEQFKMPPVVMINRGYLHRNNFYEFFLVRLFALKESMSQDLVKTMENLLRTNNRERKTLFFSRENFETEIIERLRGMDPFLSEVFEKPRLLNEAVIYTLKEKRKTKDLLVVKDELQKYFKPDTMIYRSLTSILGLSIIDIFLRAFAGLPIWRQIWLRVTGKYEGYQSQYIGQSIRSAAVAVFKAKQNGGSGRHAPAGRSGETALKDRPRAALDRSEAGKKAPKPAPAKKKSYSKKQQETAWEEFSKTIKPK